MLTISLFGYFEASSEGQMLDNLHLRDADRLLAFLALQGGRTQSCVSVAQYLWPTTGSMDSLRQSVTVLRRALGHQDGRLDAPKGKIALDLSNADVDVLAFDAEVVAFEEAALKGAVARYRAPLLQEWEDSWVQREREKRRGACLEALRTLARLRYEEEDWTAASHYLRRYVSLHPAEERAWADLMQALIRGGERVAAIDLYHRYRDYLQKKYKMAPSGEMTAWYEKLRMRPSKAETDSTVLLYLEPTGGAVPLDSPYYISRPVDHQFTAALKRRDSIVLVKGPRQTGKTSLLARGLKEARESGSRVILTDLQKLSGDNWATTEAFYMALAQSLADQLDLKQSPQEVWSAHRGANENFERYLRHQVIASIPSPVIWGLDEVDRLFSSRFNNEVFALFRSWHNERSLDPEGPWDRFTLAIAYATEAHLFISDLNQSPFNVGTRLLLEDFSPDQVAELNRRYGSPLKEASDLRRFIGLVGGHPYLVQRGLYEIVTQGLSSAAFETQAGLDTGWYGDHLQRMLIALSRDPQLCAVLKGILQGRACPDTQSFYRLKSAGLIVGDDPDRANMRSLLYQVYLETHLP